MKKISIEQKAFLAMQISPYVINNLSPDVINNLSPYVIKNLSPDVQSAIGEKIREWEDIPVIEKPYTTLLKDINEKRRCYHQSTYGDIEEFKPEMNICNSQMCIAGHLVNMAGEQGYILKKKYGWFLAATLIHKKTHEVLPAMNFSLTDQGFGQAYLEYAADFEAGKVELPKL